MIVICVHLTAPKTLGAMRHANSNPFTSDLLI